ncbi:MAG: hypothetical protein RR416_05450 [Clostridia bacterium]
MSIFNLIFRGIKKSKGFKLEEKVAKAIRKKVPIESRNKTYYKNGKRYTETDIETRTCSIEVKSGKKGQRLATQLKKQAEVTKKEAIAYAPKIPTYIKNEVRRQGFGIYSKLNDLTSYVDNKENKKRRIKK